MEYFPALIPLAAFAAGVARLALSAAGRPRREDELMDRWIETTDRISARRDTAGIRSFLAEACAESVGAGSAHLWLHDGPSRSYVANTSAVAPAFRRLSAAHSLLERIRATGPLPFGLGELGGDEGTRALARELGARLCVPLIANREIAGFMLLGKKRGGAPYEGPDLRLLRAVATQAAVQVMNIRLSEDLMDMKETELFSRASSFVAHDLKNLASSLALLAHNAKTSMRDPAFQREAVRAVEATAAGMRLLVDRLSGTRGLELNMTMSDLREVAARASARLSPGARARIVAPEGPPAECLIDEEQMETVFVNILSNAAEATAGGGEILVGFRASVTTVEASIEDSGTGMPLPFLENGLFRPFRTTKKGGFGIGLYQCRTIVEAHGGAIEVGSVEGKGTSFRLILPAAGAAGARFAG